MHKKYILLLVCILLYLTGFSQSQELQMFNQERLQINRIGMLTLGGWALGNMGTAAFSLGKASGSNKYFHQMNIYWNVVNLALAGFGYYEASTADPLTYNLFGSLKEHYAMEKILLFNAGLDVGYMAGGLYLMERAKNSQHRQELFKGFGQSVIIQGGFLFMFDLTMYFLHHANESVIKGLLSNVSFQGNAIHIILRF